MKKLKIFLLLSILLCFGFTLNIEVHAQGYGSKAFKTGVVLPATSQLRIIVDIPSSVGGMSTPRTGTTGGYLRFTVYNNGTGGEYYEDYYCDVLLDGSWISLTDYNLSELINNEWIPSEDEEFGYSIISIIIDTSTWTETQRTITNDNHDTHPIYWEDLNAPPGPKPFEVGDVLPAGNIKISWDFTDKHIDVLHVFSILGDSESDDGLNIEISSYGDSGSIIVIFINDNEFFVNEPGGTILTLTEPITIHTVEGYETYDYEPLDYYEYIDDALLWEVVSQDYTDGYEDGYAYAGVSYELGREHAREIYGYYDPITNQWLTVSEYLSLYGTDKPGQSDFYGNFDKYFIPALIIVFGGAIVLTILKVFKGRE